MDEDDTVDRGVRQRPHLFFDQRGCRAGGFEVQDHAHHDAHRPAQVDHCAQPGVADDRLMVAQVGGYHGDPVVVLGEQRLPAGLSAVVLDRRGVIIASTQEIKEPAGTPAAPEVRRMAGAAAEGWFAR